jgi:hypothetical protein
MQNAMVKQLVADAGPLLDPKLRALQDKMSNTLRTAAGESPVPKAPAAGAKAPAKAASH